MYKTDGNRVGEHQAEELMILTQPECIKRLIEKLSKSQIYVGKPIAANISYREGLDR